MSPTVFDEINCNFTPPPTLEESQCAQIRGYHGVVERGSLEGAKVIVVAWKPSDEDLMRLLNGSPVFLSVFGGLPPHMLTTSFAEAITPA